MESKGTRHWPSLPDLRHEKELFGGFNRNRSAVLNNNKNLRITRLSHYSLYIDVTFFNFLFVFSYTSRYLARGSTMNAWCIRNGRRLRVTYL